MYSLGEWRLLGLCARRAAAPNFGGARLRNFLILLSERPVVPIRTLPMPIAAEPCPGFCNNFVVWNGHKATRTDDLWQQSLSGQEITLRACRTLGTARRAYCSNKVLI